MTTRRHWRPWNPASDDDEGYYFVDQRLDDIVGRYLADPLLAEIAKTATRYVDDELGDTHPRVLFIGEAPGEQEDKEGQPFVGSSGKYLDNELAPLFINRQRHYTTNVVKHRPINSAGKNRTPTPEEIDAARPFLLEEIDALDPPIIITLGNVPLKALWPDAPGVTSVHGRPRVLADGRVHLPAVHPSYAMRTTSAARALADDLAMLGQLIAITRRVLVTGSRTWPSPDQVAATLDDELAAGGPFTLVHGRCNEGADYFADQWFASRSPMPVRVDRHPADWPRCAPDGEPGHRRANRRGGEYCPTAGHRRNQLMVDRGVERAHAFWHNGSPGTEHCVKALRAAGIEPVVPRAA